MESSNPSSKLNGDYLEKKFESEGLQKVRTNFDQGKGDRYFARQYLGMTGSEPEARALGAKVKARADIWVGRQEAKDKSRSPGKVSKFIHNSWVVGIGLLIIGLLLTSIMRRG